MVELDVHEQVELIRQYKRLEAEIASANDKKQISILERKCQIIIDRVVEANLDLIEMMVKSQTLYESEYDDRKSDAYYRVVQCFHNYDPDKTELPFRHYLAKELKRHLKKRRVNLKKDMPVSFHEVCNKINIVYNQLCLEKKGYVSKKDVADAMMIDVSKIESLLSHKCINISIDKNYNSVQVAGYGDYDNTTMHDILSSELYDDPFNETSSHELGELMPILAENLPEGEKLALSMGFHTPYLCRITLDQIASEHPAVAKRVKALEKELLAQGLNPSEIRTFQSFFDCCQNLANNPMPKILKDQGF